MAGHSGDSSRPTERTPYAYPIAQRGARQQRWILTVVLSIAAIVAIVGNAYAFQVGPFATGVPSAQMTRPVVLAAQLGDAPAAGATTSATTLRTTATTPRSCAGHYYRTIATQVIVVCLREQWLYAYQNGTLVFSAPVVTGQPGLATPTGVTKIFYKGRNLTFISPWPKGSPYYYYPTHINYAMEFHAGGFFLHDAWWHSKFGPGANVPHRLPNGTWETGSHGCVGMSIANAKWLYNWSHVGTTVVVSWQ